MREWGENKREHYSLIKKLITPYRIEDLPEVSLLKYSDIIKEDF